MDNHGNLTQRITLHAPSDDRTEVVDALVATGATFTSVPAPVLERMGIAPVGTVRLKLADREIEERDIGEVRAELNGDVRTIVCVCANPTAPAVIGAVTPEVFLLSVDPVERRLVPVIGYWL